MPSDQHEPAAGEATGAFTSDGDDAKAAAAKLRMSHNKWTRIQHQIEHVKIGGRRFWTDRALVQFINRQTRRPAGRRNSSRART